MSDTTVRCDTCNREERVSFAQCLASGWPKCFCRGGKYGYTMRLVRTSADIGAATTSVLRSQTERPSR